MTHMNKVKLMEYLTQMIICTHVFRVRTTTKEVDIAIQILRTVEQEERQGLVHISKPNDNKLN